MLTATPVATLPLLTDILGILLVIKDAKHLTFLSALDTANIKGQPHYSTSLTT
jgi:hypothetical protein